MSVFVFKQFSVKQEFSAMKIGTDAVLLGCIADVEHAGKILDIGTGTGILALMMAQRSNAEIDAVETDSIAATEAAFNFKQSQWAERLNLHHQPVQAFAQQTRNKYDLVISNPPYFINGENSAINNEQRSKARHTKELSFEELITCVASLLSANGSFWMILPVAEAQLFYQLSNGMLYLHYKVNIKPKKDKAVNRIIMKFGLTENIINEEELVVYNDDNTPSHAYRQLAADFYTGKQFAI